MTIYIYSHQYSPCAPALHKPPKCRRPRLCATALRTVECATPDCKIVFGALGALAPLSLQGGTLPARNFSRGRSPERRKGCTGNCGCAPQHLLLMGQDTDPACPQLLTHPPGRAKAKSGRDPRRTPSTACSACPTPTPTTR